jgi:hypothetical protein
VMLLGILYQLATFESIMQIDTTPSLGYLKSSP